METIPQDVLNIITSHLSRETMIHLSCTCQTINKMFDDESLWFMLLKRDYPNLISDETKSNYELYYQEYVNNNVTTYIGIYYWTEFDGNLIYSPRFLKVQDAFEWLWKNRLSKYGIFKQYYHLPPQLARLVKVLSHFEIVKFYNCETPLEILRTCLLYNSDLADFIYDEDISYQECLDLMHDYMDHVSKYKDVIWGIMSNPRPRSEIWNEIKNCGEKFYIIETRKGIYDCDENKNDESEFEEYIRS